LLLPLPLLLLLLSLLHLSRLPAQLLLWLSRLPHLSLQQLLQRCPPLLVAVHPAVPAAAAGPRSP
jgi:hypothetical protein